MLQTNHSDSGFEKVGSMPSDVRRGSILKHDFPLSLEDTLPLKGIITLLK